MVRHILLILVCMILSLVDTMGQEVRDSLLSKLQSSATADERIEVYRHLADLCYDDSLEIVYLRDLDREAQEIGNRELMIETKGALSLAYMMLDRIDSSFHYIQEIQAYDDREDARAWVAYMAMRMFNYYTFQPDQGFQINERLKEIDERSKNKHNDIYQKIKYSFILGIGLFSQGKFAEAVPHLETAAKLAQELPVKVGFNIIVFTSRYYARSLGNSGQNLKAIEQLEQLLELERDYFTKNYATQRPFYPVNSTYSIDYTTLMVNVSFLTPEKQQKYLKQILSLCNSSEKESDRYNYYLCLNNYYSYKNEIGKAVETNDSLIRLAQKIAPYNLAGLYQVGSRLCVKVKEYEQAYKYLRLAFEAKDSLNKEQARMELDKLQVQYGVDKLNYEKVQLENRNKQIVLSGLGIFLIIVTVICIYLYRNLKQEKILKEQLRILMLKADESEKMKTAFLNSICHEVRTPLNAIVGFTDLVLDESLELELRKTFPDEIKRNAFLLTSLVNSMLEVSNLDVSDDLLPCEPVDIVHLMSMKMYDLRRHHKPGIEYCTDIAAESLVISTNDRYLGLVIDHLLENANKFTEQGHITLYCRKENDRLVIAVSDTGCGIPLDRHQEVFERFTKLDEYKQGSGLGLYLCKTIVRRLGGEIQIDIAYTGGTRFVISLPIDHPVAPFDQEVV